MSGHVDPAPPGAVARFMDHGGFRGEYFAALPDAEQLAVRDSYWTHLRVVLQHGSRLDNSGARVMLYDERDAVAWGSIHKVDLIAVWAEVRCTPVATDAWDVLWARVEALQGGGVGVRVPRVSLTRAHGSGVKVVSIKTHAIDDGPFRRHISQNDGQFPALLIFIDAVIYMLLY
jgi:hypothetical protein